MKFIIRGSISTIFIIRMLSNIFSSNAWPGSNCFPRELGLFCCIHWIKLWCKTKTGKFPVEHIFQREKEKIVKKIDLIETIVQDKSNLVKAKLLTKKINYNLKV